MKNYFLFFAFLLLQSCSSSSDDNNSANLFNPPAWIQGTWLQEGSRDGYKFTSNNVCLVFFTTQFCIKEQIESTIRVGANASVDEIINDNQEYKFSYTIEGTTINYHFRKKSTSTIEFESDNGFNPTFTKQ